MRTLFENRTISPLKHRAQMLARDHNVSLNEALNRVAGEEGWSSWKRMAVQTSAKTASELLARLGPGDLVLLGARPGQGKTLMGVQLLAEAMKQGRCGMFFTLEYTQTNVRDRFNDLGEELDAFEALFTFDGSDAIRADYIIEQLESAPSGAVVVIDYLQRLDHNRENPELMVQVQALKAFAKAHGFIMVFISQIDRGYDPQHKPCPSLEDVLLPNPLDLTLFDKTCFLNDGEVEIATLN